MTLSDRSATAIRTCFSCGLPAPRAHRDGYDCVKAERDRTHDLLRRIYDRSNCGAGLEVGDPLRDELDDLVESWDA